MNQTGHILRKDLKRLRWALLAWTLVVAGRVVFTVVEPSIAFGGLDIIVANLSGLLTLLDILLLALIVSWLVHADPPVGADAFWLTRPIDRSALTTAKLTLAGLFLLLVPFIGHALTMTVMGATVGDVVGAAPTFVLSQVLWVVLLLALATVTPSLTRFALAIAAAMAAIALGVGFSVSLLMLREPDVSSYSDSLLSDPTAGIVSVVVLSAAMTGVVVFQYRKRWTSRAVLLATAGFVVSLIVSATWPWHFAAPIEPDPGAWARSASVTAAIDSDVAPQISDEFTLRRMATPRKQIAVPLHLTDVPAGYSVRSTGVRASLALPAGTTLHSEQNIMTSARRSDRRPDRTERLQTALGGRVWSPDEGGYEQWPVVLTVTDPQYDRYRRNGGRLELLIDFRLNRTTAIGTLPLVSGAALRHGATRFDVVRVVRRPDGCMVLLRWFIVRKFLAPEAPAYHEFVLRNRLSGDAFVGDTRTSPHEALSISNFSIGHSSDEDFFVQTVAITYPARTSSSADPTRIDGAWLSEAELVVVESAYAGHVTRMLTVDGFRMNRED